MKRIDWAARDKDETKAIKTDPEEEKRYVRAALVRAAYGEFVTISPKPMDYVAKKLAREGLLRKEGTWKFKGIEYSSFTLTEKGMEKMTRMRA